MLIRSGSSALTQGESVFVDEPNLLRLIPGLLGCDLLLCLHLRHRNQADVRMGEDAREAAERLSGKWRDHAKVGEGVKGADGTVSGPLSSVCFFRV